MFNDHFSAISGRYAQARPRYPDALFDWVAAQCAAHETAWDCATGNGQAATGLVSLFSRVIATDASAEQIRHAIAHPRVEYRVARAERSGLEDVSVDLVTIAQALHWLPRAPFYAECRRVLRRGGVLAAWGYHVPLVPHPGLNSAIRHFHDDVIGPWWPPERQLVLDRFTTVDFPFDEIAAPDFEMRHAWTLDAFAGYLRTTSVTQRYMAAHHGVDPVSALVEAIAPLWGPPGGARDVCFPLVLRAGRA